MTGLQNVTVQYWIAHGRCGNKSSPHMATAYTFTEQFPKGPCNHNPVSWVRGARHSYVIVKIISGFPVTDFSGWIFTVAFHYHQLVKEYQPWLYTKLICTGCSKRISKIYCRPSWSKLELQLMAKVLPPHLAHLRPMDIHRLHCVSVENMHNSTNRLNDKRFLVMRMKDDGREGLKVICW